MTMFLRTSLFFWVAFAGISVAAPETWAQDFDLIIKGGTVFDGTGAEGRTADVAIRGDRIAGVGDFKNAAAKNVINAHGFAVAPGFINMLSWSVESLIVDGHRKARFARA